ncbi:hypothetical protein Q1695_015657 [Nippostrongylus brasiliensis]|nr:hypothetical protein Q1695_015657 [Nippostrongylus brasiliensis]
MTYPRRQDRILSIASPSPLLDSSDDNRRSSASDCARTSHPMPPLDATLQQEQFLRLRSFRRPDRSIQFLVQIPRSF